MSLVRIRGLRAFNKCHAPAGSSKGGQFCSDAAGNVYEVGPSPAKVVWKEPKKAPPEKVAPFPKGVLKRHIGIQF